VDIFLSKSVFGYLKTKKEKKKIPMTTKLGGIKALVVGQLKNNFFAASLRRR